MMNKRVLYGLAAILMAASCQTQEMLLPEPQDIEPGIDVGMKEMIITAETEGNSQDTRTSLVIEEDNSTKVLWTPGDEIKIFSAGESAKFTAINEVPSRKAKFRGKVSMIFGEDEEGGEKDYVWGLYPYRDDATYSEPDGEGISRTAVITTTVPSNQEGKPGTFADNVATMIGRSEASLLISYKNAYSGVIVRFNRDDIVSVTVRGRHNETLAGRVAFGLDNRQLPFTKYIISDERAVTITDSENGTFIPEENYFLITLPDVNLEEGYSLTVKRSDGKEATFNSLTNVNQFIRNKFRSFKNPLDTYIEDEDNINSGRSSGWRSSQPQDNEIWYRSSNDGLIEYTVDNATGNEIVENIPPEDNFGVGIIRFSAPLKAVDQGAFQSKANLLEVTLPETIDTIKKYSFRNCENLTTVNMSDNVKYILYRAFSDCRSLEEIRLSESLYELDYEAFEYCINLTEITLPESLTALGKVDNVGYFGNPFYGCSNLSKFNGKFASADGRCLIAGGGNSNFLISFATGGIDPTSTYVVPEEVTSIRVEAFAEATMRSVTLPEGLTQIFDYAFLGCGNLLTVSVPSTVTWFGSHVFEECNNLRRIDLNMTSIVNVRASFSGTDFKGHMFDNTNECPIYVPSNLLEGYRTAECWADYAKRYTYEQPDNEIWYTTEGDQTLVFTDAEKTSFGIIGERYDTPDITNFPKGVIIFNDPVTAVPEGLFKDRTNIKTATLSKFVTEIGNEAFMGCTGLTLAPFESSNITRIGDDAFNGCSSMLLFEGTPFSPDYGMSFTKLSYLGARAFKGCTSLNYLIMFYQTQVTIGESAFEDSSLPRFVSSCISDLGAGAFKNCTGLNSSYNIIGGTMTEIKESTFEGCQNLKSLRFAGGTKIKTIGNNAFYNCKSLETIGKTECIAALPDVTTIGEGVFQYAKIAQFDLTSLNKAGRNAFIHLDQLSELYLPAIKEMSYDMFTPRALVKLHLGENVDPLNSRLWQYAYDSSTQTFEVELYLDKPSMVSVSPGYTFVTKNNTSDSGVQILKVKAVYVPSDLVDTYRTSSVWQEALAVALPEGKTIDDVIQPMPTN